MSKYGCCLLLIFSTTFLFAQERPKGMVVAHDQPRVQYGTASYYANKFQGRPTASGVPYDKTKLTCAHNGLPLNTWVKVTNLRNHRSVVVKVTDRLHHKNKRLVDLSGAAAAKLGYLKRGLTRVKLEVLDHAPVE